MEMYKKRYWKPLCLMAATLLLGMNYGLYDRLSLWLNAGLCFLLYFVIVHQD